MEKKANDIITVSRDELKSEMRSALSEVVNDGVKNIGELLISTFCGTSVAVPKSTPAPEEEEKTAIPPKDELLKIVSGYLYMALGELKYERKDIMPIIQRIEKHMNNNDYETALTAYKNAENEFLAMIESSVTTVQTVPAPTSRKIAGIEVPAKIHDYTIEMMDYVNNISKAKTANSLRNKGITQIKHFFKAENSDLNKVLSQKGKKSFIEALKRTISNTPTETSPVTESTVPEIPKRDVYEFNGVVIPEEMLNKSVDSLNFPSKISRTKITKRFTEHNIVYLRDLFVAGNPPLYKMLSQGGRISFLKILRNSVKGQSQGDES